MSRREALEKLFLDLFSPQELRIFLGHEPDSGDLMASLPIEGPNLTAALMASMSVDALAHRGLIDRPFFDRLRAARPVREVEIREVRRQWLRGNEVDVGALWGDGRYELLARWGSGGIGTVWKAEDKILGCRVAIKILNEQISDDRRLRTRFFRGIDILSRLTHPAIVGVRAEVEQEGSHYFCVMDFLDGVSLESLLGNSSREILLKHVLHIGDALIYIHSKQLFHRDVKPGNIIITEDGRAILIDFDLVTGDDYFPLTTVLPLGTPGYSAPEAGTPQAVTAAYDVYGLARTTEDVLRGAMPAQHEFASLNRLDNLDVSRAVRSVLRAALHPSPVERTQSIEKFCNDLCAALRGEEVSQPSGRKIWPLMLAVAGIAAGITAYKLLPTLATVCPANMKYVPPGDVNNQRVPGFCYDLYEVTVADFKHYIDSLSGEGVQGNGSARDAADIQALTKSLSTVSFPRINKHLDDPVMEKERLKEKASYDANCTWPKRNGLAYHPINCITHTEAQAFCESYGKRLPTRNEWWWAASGAGLGLDFPWGGEDPSPRYGNMAKDSKGNIAKDAKKLDGEPMQVGIFPPSALGFHDLGGNLSEWIACEQEPDLCSNVGGNFRNFLRTNFLVKFVNPGALDQEIIEANELKKSRSDVVGFRCVMTPTVF